MAIIYESQGHVVVSYVEKKHYMLFDWSDFAIELADIQRLHERALDWAATKRCYAFVADTSRVKNELSQEIIDWWGRVWVPRLAAYKLKTIVTVVPKTATALLSTHKWQRQVMSGIVMANVRSLAEAETVVRETR